MTPMIVPLGNRQVAGHAMASMERGKMPSVRVHHMPGIKIDKPAKQSHKHIGVVTGAQFALNQGDSILCFTDGVTEAQTSLGEEFASDRSG